MATLKDIAKLVNVDVSTVSRALSGKAYVHPDTKEKIYKAVAELSYQPNLLAKGLRQGKRNTLGILIPNLKLNIMAEMAQYIEDYARNKGYSVILGTTSNDPKVEKDRINRFRTGLVDGLIIVSTGKNKRLIRDIKAEGMSVVQLVRNQDDTISSVTSDYKGSGAQGVEYLVEHGCKRIGFINGSAKVTPYFERNQGYNGAMEKLGLVANVICAPDIRADSFAVGYSGVDVLLSRDTNLNGILVATDMIALGALRRLKELSIAVPDTVQVMSLTGHSIGAYLANPLTSMEMPSREMARKVADMIIEDIEAPKNEKPSLQHLIYSPVLVERETTRSGI